MHHKYNWKKILTTNRLKAIILKTKKLKTKKLKTKKLTTKILNVFYWLFVGGVGLLALRVLLLVVVFDTFHTPTESMTPTLRPGDRGYIDKLKLGGRIFDIYAAAAGEDHTVRRLPGYGRLERGDIIIFNAPWTESWDSVAMNMYLYYCKRAVAVAGDTLEIRRGFYRVRGSDDTVGVASEQRLVERIVAPQVEAACYDSLPGWMKVFPKDRERHWTIVEAGPLVIPAQGTRIRLDSLNLLTYRKYIEWETGRKAEWRDGVARIGGVKTPAYTFRENYCFAAGDHAIDSQDSRYWGLLPEKFIVGVAVKF